LIYFFTSTTFDSTLYDMETLIKEKVEGLEITGFIHPGFENILTPEALQFIAALHRQFNSRRLHLLRQRAERQKRINLGELPQFPAHTRAIRDSEWRVAPIPACLQDRRVEITGPVDRKMIVNALNSGAKVFMADFEDSTSPTWENILEGQVNLYDAVRRQIDFEQADGKRYELNEHVAVLKVRPRGWHLHEKHILIDGEPASASMVDFGLFFFHNARLLAAEQKGPFFYLPKLESFHEARLWNDIFIIAQDMLRIPRATIKVTVLIETMLAAFEMDEIIYELREHLAGLNAGRWDYIFSIIKKMHCHRDFILPERSRITMGVPFMQAYAKLLVKTCHRRGAHAIGGMSAFIPSRDEVINAKAFEQVKADKEREANTGYDGTWVAHPKLVEVAKEIFDKKIGRAPHQKHVMLEDLNIPAHDLLEISSVQRIITEAGFRTNINVALLYIESWLKGVGAAALYNLMEDAATAEISRAQLWQWLHHKNIQLEDGRRITEDLYQQLLEEEYLKVSADSKDTRYLEQARKILDRLVMNEHFEDFLTIKAYEYLN
jgi:malate synthase